jgi:hypothetical protein
MVRRDELRESPTQFIQGLVELALREDDYFVGTGNFCCMADWICVQGRQFAPFVPAATPVA